MNTQGGTILILGGIGGLVAASRLCKNLVANIFNGSRNGMAGILGDNDNVYLTVRYIF